MITGITAALTTAMTPAPMATERNLLTINTLDSQDADRGPETLIQGLETGVTRLSSGNRAG